MQSRWRLFVVDFGVNVSSLCQRANISTDIFNGTNSAWLSRIEYNRLWEALEAETADSLVGLRMGRWVASDNSDPSVVTLYCSANLTQAVECLGEYAAAVSPMTVCAKMTPFSVDIEVGRQAEDGSERVHFQPKVAILASLLECLRRATRDPSIRPQRVQLEQGARDAEAYRSFFGVEPVFGGPTQMSLSLLDAKRRFLTHKPMFWRLMAPVLQAGAGANATGGRTVEVVRQCLVEMLPMGRSQIVDVATELGVGVRTLQRRLAVEDESFQTILRGTRERLAKQYLRDGDLSVEQISVLLGFESTNSLYRAFQKWTGKTPESFRESSAAT